jgi:hypothetical protein
MKRTTEIEVNEIPTEAQITFEVNADGGIEIKAVKDAHSGLLLDINVPDMVYNECHEYYSDMMAERRANGRRTVSC